MSYDDDDTVLYPDRVYAERPTGLARSSGVPTMPNEATFRAFLDGPDIEAVSAPAFAILERKRSFLAKLFRAFARAEAIKDAAAAAEIMRYIRQFLAEYEGAQDDAALHVQSVIGRAQQTDRAVRLHDLRTELDLQGLREANAAAEANRRRRRVADARAEAVIDGGTRAALGPAYTAEAADPWDAQDDISRRARIAAITGAASVDSEKIDDPAVAFAALTYVKKLQAGADEDTARRAAFSDVRDLIAANRLGPKDAETYSQALKQARTEFKKTRDSKAGLGLMAAAITGRKA